MAHRYDRTADFIVVEGPKAGGHLGFSNEQLAHMDAINFDGEIRQIIDCKKEYEQRYQKNIPVIVAGGIFDQKDISHALDLGADGVQIASRFVATEECDASEAYKERIFTPMRKILRLSKARSVCRDVHCAISLSTV